MSESQEPVEISRHKHPVQLKLVGVRELHIRTFRPVKAGTKLDGLLFALPVGTSEIDEDKEIQVSVWFKADKEDNEDANVEINAEIIGVFVVDTDRFDVSNLEHWSLHNAPFILYPYLREQVYNLTQRCGFAPLIMPSLEIPIFKATKSTEETPD